MSESSAWGEPPSLERQNSGSWLYQHVGNLYGPIPTDILLDRIRKGKLPESIVVCEDGHDDFVPITKHPFLKDEAKKAFAAAKQLAERQARQRKDNAKKMVIVVLSAIVLVSVSGGGYYGYSYNKRMQVEAAHRRKQEADALALKLRQEEEKKAADAAEKDDVDLDLDLLPLVSVNAKKMTVVKGRKGKSEVEEGPQGCQLDQASIQSTFRASFGNLKACIKDEIRRGETYAGTLTLEFTIANTGSVSSFETDDRKVRTGPFFECLKRVVSGMHFPNFPGERCNVNYPITIGKK